MTALDREPQVEMLAKDLGLPSRGAPAEAVVRYCREVVSGVLRQNPGLSTLGELHQVVARHLKVAFEEVNSDKDLESLIKKYVAKREFIFANLPNMLVNDTFAELIELNVSADASVRYVAVIDCREPQKSVRRYFTRWHEMAHALTLSPHFRPPFNRSSHQRCPIERLMDEIAGEVGFFEPLFLPTLQEETSRDGDVLTLDAIQRVRDRLCPDASFQSVLFAAMKKISVPLFYVEGELEYKKAERNELESNQMALFDGPTPEKKLRAVQVLPNPDARLSGLRIHENMQIPERSVIARVFFSSERVTEAAEENLAWWTHSNGKALAAASVRVEARGLEGKVIALVQPLGRTV